MALPRPLDTTMADRKRFWRHVDKDGPISRLGTRCWVWTAYRDKKGYGIFKLSGTSVKAHRVSFVMHGGVIPGQGQVDHMCRHTSCIRPDHLEGVTGSENRRRQQHVIQDYFDLNADRWEEAQHEEPRPLQDARSSTGGFSHDDDF